MVSICGFVCALMLSDAERQQHTDVFVRTQQQTQTFQADVKQTVRLHGLKKPVESIGRLFYKAPDKLRIQFTQPAGEYLLIVGNDVFSKKTNRPLRRSKDPNAGMLLKLFQGDVSDWQHHRTRSRSTPRDTARQAG
jgi:outer membrane lipoprotein-sorting protein